MPSYESTCANTDASHREFDSSSQRPSRFGGPSRSVFSKLVWRERTGGLRHYNAHGIHRECKPALRSLAARFYDACPPRLCVPFTDILDAEGRIAAGCVVLGFTRTGHVVSYACAASFAAATPATTATAAAASRTHTGADSYTYTYRLQLWHFRLGAPLSLACDVPLFRCRPVRADLLISVTESEGGGQLTVHGAESTALARSYAERRQCHVTVVDVNAVLSYACTLGDEAHVLHFVFELPDRYAYVPAVSARTQDTFVMNSGDGVTVFTWRHLCGTCHDSFSDCRARSIPADETAGCVAMSVRRFDDNGRECETGGASASLGLSAVHARACELSEARFDAEQFLGGAIAREGSFSPVDYEVRLVDLITSGELLLLVTALVREQTSDADELVGCVDGRPLLGPQKRFRLAWLVGMDTRRPPRKGGAGLPLHCVLRRWPAVPCAALGKDSVKDIHADIRRMGLLGIPRCAQAVSLTLTNVAVLRGQSLDHLVHPFLPLAIVFKRRQIEHEAQSGLSQ